MDELDHLLVRPRPVKDWRLRTTVRLVRVVTLHPLQGSLEPVLNRTPGQKVPEETRQRVLAAAEELRYAPHASARTLRSGSSRLALCVVPEMAFGANIAVTVTQMTQGMSELGVPLATWQRTGLLELATTLSDLQPQVIIGLLGLTEDKQDLLRDLGVPYVDVSRLLPSETPPDFRSSTSRSAAIGVWPSSRVTTRC